ncbi:hypothetical protein BC830DRAFT_115524 [Chytriomyces sp. MP71]|nr:hypothetical protein BC830DRAFT_115524 [Chytriomyces sp. MP71]
MGVEGIARHQGTNVTHYRVDGTGFFEGGASNVGDLSLILFMAMHCSISWRCGRDCFRCRKWSAECETLFACKPCQSSFICCAETSDAITRGPFAYGCACVRAGDGRCVRPGEQVPLPQRWRRALYRPHWI